MAYNYDDLREAYRNVGVTKGKTVLLKTDLRYLGSFDHANQKHALPAHFKILSDLIDLSKGTLVVSTATTSLCNTSTPFDINNTPSEMGALTEYIRRQKGSVRSFHPFVSFAAIGKHAEYICKDITRYSFGPETPKDRMINLDTMYLSVGLEPRWTCSVVHHVEMLMGVPYRYTKEFNHPIVYEDGIKEELFYMYVWYRGIELKRNRNVNLFKHFCKLGNHVNEARLGGGKIYSYSMVDLYKSTIDFLKKDIYGWLDEPPKEKPYRE